MPQIQHMVIFKFKPETSSEQIAAIFNQLEQFKQTIPGIIYFVGGKYSSTENLNQGYNYGFLMTFESAEARDAYIVHPEHEKIKAEIIPCVDDLVAFDIEA
ncbi:MAG TPA: Dabb family protein [Oculatellaceae cyanobacterium]